MAEHVVPQRQPLNPTTEPQSPSPTTYLMTSSEVDKQAIADNLAAIRERIRLAAERVGRRPEDIELVAVSKTHPPEAIRAAYDAGQRLFGESYVQEWQSRAEPLSGLDDLRFHFIGGLQSNKVRELAGRVELVHSVDRAKLLREFNKRADRPQQVLLQVNISGEDTKSGCQPEEVSELLKLGASLPNVRVRGLMTVPPPAAKPEDSRPWFRKLATLLEQARTSLADSDPNAAEELVHLSMGMTDDLEVAVEEGATLVRVGTAIFGARDYS